MFNERKNIRVLTPHVRTTSTSLYLPQSSILHLSSFMSLAEAGIEPGSSAWESSTLTSEPLDARRNTDFFYIHIGNIRVHCMLNWKMYTLSLLTYNADQLILITNIFAYYLLRVNLIIIFTAT